MSFNKNNSISYQLYSLNAKFKFERHLQRQLQHITPFSLFSEPNPNIEKEKYLVDYDDQQKLYYDSDEELLNGVFTTLLHKNGNLYVMSNDKNNKFYLEKKHYIAENYEIESVAFVDCKNGVMKLITNAQQSQLYIQDYARDKYLLRFKNGTFFNDHGETLDGKYNYVRLENGNVYVASQNKDSEYYVAHHSYLANGKKIRAAGELIFRQGKLEQLTNHSGHYTLTNEEMCSDIEYFFHISKNPILIYEDHSSHPINKKIKRFIVSVLLDNDFCFDHPYHIYEGDSNFGADPKKPLGDPPIPRRKTLNASEAVSAPTADLKPNYDNSASNYDDPDHFLERTISCRH